MAQKAIVFGANGAAVSALASGLRFNTGTLEVVFRRTGTTPYPGRRVLAGVYLSRSGMASWAPIYGLMADGTYPYAHCTNTQTWTTEAIQSTHLTPTAYEHWSMTWETVSGTCTILLYRNGSLVSTTTSNNVAAGCTIEPIPTGGTALVALGSIASADMTESFIEFRLWNTVRDAATILGAVNRPLNAGEIADASLIGYWKPETTEANGDSAVGDTLAASKGSVALVAETAATWASDTPVAFDAPSEDTEPPTPGALSLASNGPTSVVVNVGAGSDNVGVVSRTLRIYSDAALTTKVGNDIAASIGDSTISGLAANTPYWVVCVYRDAAGNTATSAVLSVATEPTPIDNTPPTAGTVTISGITQSGATATVTAGSDNSGTIASRTLRVYSDSGLTTLAIPAIAAQVGANSIGGLLGGTDYWVTCTYADPSGNTAVSATVAFTTTVAASYPAVLAVRPSATLGQAGKWATAGYDIPAAALAGDFTLMFTAKWGAWDTTVAGTYHNRYIRLVDSVGRERVLVARNASPWLYFRMGTGSAMTPSSCELYKGSAPRAVYDTFWMVYKAPQLEEAGYLRVYINGDNAYRGESTMYEETYVAGSAPIAWGGGDLKLEIGSETPIAYPYASNATENFNVADLALWGRALDTDRDYAGTFQPWGGALSIPLYRSATLRALSQSDFLALPSNDASRTGLLAYIRPTTAHIGGNVPVALGSLSTVELASNGANASLSSDLPAWFGTASALPPTGCMMGTVTPGATSVTVASVSGGTPQGAATGYCKRAVYVTKARQYRDIYAATTTLPADGTLVTGTVLSGLASGTTYRVVAEWEDALGNVRTQEQTVTTTGALALPTTRRSLALTGVTDTKHSACRIPTDDGVTIRAYVRRNAGDTGGNSAGRIVFGIDDALNDGSSAVGYHRLQMRIMSDGAAHLFSCDGDTPKGPGDQLSAGAVLPIGTWVECWVQIRPPLVGQTGEMAIWVGANPRVTRTLPAVTSRQQDWFWKKWLLHFRVGGTSDTGVQANVSDATIWTRYLSVAEMTAIAGKDVRTLDDATALSADLFAHYQGHGTGSTDPFAPAFGTSVGAVGFDTSVPLGLNVAYDAAVPTLTGGVTPPTNILSLRPMARACSVQLNIQTAGGGVEPTSNVVEWRTPGGQWKRAQPLKRVMNEWVDWHTPETPLMATILLGLEEGQTYEVRATCSGTGYAGIPSVAQTFTTLTSNVPAKTGSTVVVTVDETTTSAQIYAAINSALSASAPANNAGKVVEFRSAHGPGVRTVVRAAIAGLYSTGSGHWKWSGTSGAWLTLRTADAHNIIFEGSSATYDTTGADLWEAYEDAGLGIVLGDGIYRTRSAVAKPGAVFCEPTLDAISYRLNNVTSGQSWQDYSRDATLYSTGLPTLKERADMGEYAFCWNSADGKLYVRLLNGADPDTCYMKLPNPALGSCLNIGYTDAGMVRNLLVENIRWQHFLGPDATRFSKGALSIQGCDGVVVRGLDLRGLVEFLNVMDSTGPTRQNVVISGNRFRNTTHPAVINWKHLKYSPQESVALWWAGKAASFLDNWVEGVFNGWTNYGIFTQPTVWDGTQTTCAEAMELDGNTFVGCGDDAIEPEQGIMSLAVTRNTFLGCYKGISMAPVFLGPVFVCRNLWYGRGEYQLTSDKQAFVKFGNSEPGDTAYKLVANNTVVNLNDDAVNGRVLVGIADSGTFANAEIRNNYVSSDGFSVDLGYGAMNRDIVFDYNVYRQRRPLVNLPAFYADPMSQGCFPGTLIAPPLGTSVTYNGVTRVCDAGWFYAQADRGFFAVVRRDAGYYGESSEDGGHRDFEATNAGFMAWKAGRPDHSCLIPMLTNRGFVLDPHSTFEVGTHELINPAGGDFRPALGSTAVGAGGHLDNITRDVGPGWSDYDEGATLNPTVGALLVGDAAPNQSPVVTVSAVTNDPVVGNLVTGTFTATDPDGTTPVVSGTLATPSGPSSLTIGAGTWSFTPDVAGIYTVSISAADDYVTTTQTLAVVVTDVPSQNHAPTVQATGAVITVGAVASIGVAIADDDAGDTHTVAAVFAAKPSASTRGNSDLDITYDALLRSGTVRFVPDVSGDYLVTITVSDGAAQATTQAVVVASSAGGVDDGDDGDYAGDIPTRYTHMVVLTNEQGVLVDVDGGTALTWRIYPHTATRDNGYVLSGAALRIATGMYFVVAPMSGIPLVAEHGYAVVAVGKVGGVERRVALPELVAQSATVDRVRAALDAAVGSLRTAILSRTQRTEVAYVYTTPDTTDNAVRHVGATGTKVNYMRYRLDGVWYYDWHYYASDDDTKVAFIRTFTVPPAQT